ncbi:phosphopantothenate--cysteine ligase [Enterococcus cecorum]|uniref:phosphopantothenate--cysteine ligase n=1 Tax=Enterococcus cecorum TaxID=44008 RepID=UPI002AC9F43F|nr:phosphopantothenate--cysteine ligase [Enterococcus cecorum]MDZ5589412.1 phosphopantothenate--cysteine ligase [Enterococcus cecorum]
MKVLITAGGTSEPIDQVRSITNHASGALGIEIAKVFLQNDVKIDYVVTKSAKKPAANEHLKMHLVNSTQEVYDCLKQLLTTQKYSAVIHTMAISDFTTQASLSIEALTTALNQAYKAKDQLQEEDLLALFASMANPTASKISSKTKGLVLSLQPTPKIIQSIKHWQHTTVLFGFKLLANVTQENLLQVARNSLEKNQADFVIANDLSEVDTQQHHAYLLDTTGKVIAQGYQKSEIAQMIFKQWQQIYQQKEE